ncbi:hypothetical protein V6N11_046333 [Hibiscus sabdariffa]|uniref:Uncharacterized protein n=1 Tax=Hibiscus sabdariffa TaxID=183260 RepID=A0ABR2P2I8_9ROSI
MKHDYVNSQNDNPNMFYKLHSHPFHVSHHDSNSNLPLSSLLVTTTTEALSMKLPLKWFIDPGVMDSRFRFLVAVEIVPSRWWFIKVGAGFHGITSVLLASDACCISHFLKEMYRGQRAASKNWNFWPM